MTIHTLPVTQPAPRADVLSHPIKAFFSATLASWMAGHRRRADTALLMSLEPHMLDDMGLTERRGGSTVRILHPAVLATTMSAGFPWEGDKT